MTFCKTQRFHGPFHNEEPAMRNLIIDGAAGGETKRRHDVTFPLLTAEKIVYIFLQDF
jgi:hypothetical protein